MCRVSSSVHKYCIVCMIYCNVLIRMDHGNLLCYEFEKIFFTVIVCIINDVANGCLMLSF